MAKKFNIHNWQADQVRKKLDEQSAQGVVDFGGGSNIIPDKVDSQGRNTWGDKVGYADDQIEDEISKYIGQTFASWMSPDNPPFAQEYAKPPYIDKLVKGIMGILPARMSDPNIERFPGEDEAGMAPRHNLDEMNATGTGASFNAGNSMAHFGKKKKKKSYMGYKEI